MSALHARIIDQIFQLTDAQGAPMCRIVARLAVLRSYCEAKCDEESRRSDEWSGLALLVSDVTQDLDAIDQALTRISNDLHPEKLRSEAGRVSQFRVKRMKTGGAR
jgi:hypothetical protein